MTSSGPLLNIIPDEHKFKCALQSGLMMCVIYADLRTVHCNLTQKVEDGGGHDGIDTDEEVNAHVGDEGHLCILEDP